MTIITGDDKGVWERNDTKEVLTYRDPSGQMIHVYSDHPITHAQAEAVLQHGKEAEVAGEVARKQGAAARVKAEAARARADAAAADTHEDID